MTIFWCPSSLLLGFPIANSQRSIAFDCAQFSHSQSKSQGCSHTQTTAKSHPPHHLCPVPMCLAPRVSSHKLGHTPLRSSLSHRLGLRIDRKWSTHSPSNPHQHSWGSFGMQIHTLSLVMEPLQAMKSLRGARGLPARGSADVDTPSFTDAENLGTTIESAHHASYIWVED